MIDTTTAHPGVVSPAPRGLAGRVVGVVYSPRDTYAEVAARPRVLGALAFTTLVMAATAFGFLSTETGRYALLDQQVRTLESFGRNIPDRVYEQMEASLGMARYLSLAGILVSMPLVCAVVAGLMLLIFNAVLGGAASFKQAYAIAAHSQILLALQQLFVTPLNYARESLSSATTLAVFFPMLDEGSFPARLLGWIDLFRIWWLVSLAIGIAVLYRRRTAPIAWSLLAVYGAIALIGATVMTALSGV